MECIPCKDEEMVGTRIRNSYEVLVGHPQENKQLGKPRCRRENNNNADPKSSVSSVNWIQIQEL